MINKNRCGMSGCKAESVVIHIRKPLCEKHWQKHCDENSGRKTIIIEKKT